MAYYTARENAPEFTLVADCNYPVCYGQKGRLQAKILAQAGPDIMEASGGTASNMVPEWASACLTGIEMQAVKTCILGQEENLTLEQRPNGLFLLAKGKSGHAAFPQSGINAIHLLLSSIIRAEGLSDQSHRVLSGLLAVTGDNCGVPVGIAINGPTLGELTIVGTMLENVGNRISLTVDVRYPETITGKDIREKIQNFCQRQGLQLSDVHFRDSFYINPEDERVVCMMSVYREATGDMRPAFTMGGGTYSQALPRAVTFGPSIPGAGNGLTELLPPMHGGAHQPDEALHIPSFMKSISIYVETLINLTDRYGTNRSNRSNSMERCKRV